MKNILVLADGKIANAFLKRVNNLDVATKKYHVIYYHDKTMLETKSEQFFYYKFDPTSYIKLVTVLKNTDYYQVMVVLGNRSDTIASYENIRKFDSNMQIVLMDVWGLKIDDPHLTLIDVTNKLSNILCNYLPELPLSAQNIGLGIGEIMEFKVPFGSSYIYRHVANVDQKRWKIAAIFREQKLLLPTPRTMILPNDSILAVGNPNVLKSIYKSVKQEFGQFPAPFGENVYCFIDMKVMDSEDIEKLLNDSMLLHAKLNSKKLIFRISNPKQSKVLEKIKNYDDSSSFVVEIDYYNKDMQELILNDIEIYFVGLMVVDQQFFKKHVGFLYSLQIPILKVGEESLHDINESVVLSSHNEMMERISSIVFDFSALLKLDILLFEFKGEAVDDNLKLIEHFENLSKIFHEKIKILNTKRNPIRELKERKNFIQLIAFDKKVTQKNFFSIFSTDIDKLYFKLSKNYQLFIPPK